MFSKKKKRDNFSDSEDLSITIFIGRESENNHNIYEIEPVLPSDYRRDTNHRDWDIKCKPDILLERYLYEYRLHLEDKGKAILILSAKNCII